VITDSGGVQEETTALGVPCLSVRENTERPITISEGTNLLVGLSGSRLVQEARRILRGEGKKGCVPALWDGQASARIVRTLMDHVGTYRFGETVGRALPVAPGESRDCLPRRKEVSAPLAKAANTLTS
jgi:UDP-N-acetylglucosamine 2-epimerase